MKPKTRKPKTDHGKFVFLCAHKGCGKEATCHAYGMDRCKEHKDDLDPETWPDNRKDARDLRRRKP